jgi:hypothetical protein
VESNDLFTTTIGEPIMAGTAASCKLLNANLIRSPPKGIENGIRIQHGFACAARHPKQQGMQSSSKAHHPLSGQL